MVKLCKYKRYNRLVRSQQRAYEGEIRTRLDNAALTFLQLALESIEC